MDLAAAPAPGAYPGWLPLRFLAPLPPRSTTSSPSTSAGAMPSTTWRADALAVRIRRRGAKGRPDGEATLCPQDHGGTGEQVHVGYRGIARQWGYRRRADDRALAGLVPRHCPALLPPRTGAGMSASRRVVSVAGHACGPAKRSDVSGPDESPTCAQWGRGARVTKDRNVAALAWWGPRQAYTCLGCSVEFWRQRRLHTSCVTRRSPTGHAAVNFCSSAE